MSVQLDPQEYKRQLLARSETHRQAMRGSLQEVQAATSMTMGLLKMARNLAPILVLLGPVVASFVFRRKGAKTPPRPKGLLAKAVAGYNIFRQIKPIIDGFRFGRAQAAKYQDPRVRQTTQAHNRW